MKYERDQAIISLESVASKTSKASHPKNIESGDSSLDSRGSRSPSRKVTDKPRIMDGDGEVEQGGDHVWETHKVTLSRVPGFGFGIAVSGGRDNPHFANGDPAIAISDVLTAGPAEALLQINDRVLNANGYNLENVDHATAISVLKDSGNTVKLVVKRKVILPPNAEMDSTPHKVTLTKRSRKDDYGVLLGCRFYIQAITGNSLAAQEGGLKEGDTVLKVNNTPTENLSLVDARKLIERAKDKLHLVINKKRHDGHKRTNSNIINDNEIPFPYDGLKPRPHDPDDVNIYKSLPRGSKGDKVMKAQNFSHPELPSHVSPPVVSLYADHPHYDHRGFDGFDRDAPPRPPLPQQNSEPVLRHSSPNRVPPTDYYTPTREGGLYSDRENYARHSGGHVDGRSSLHREPEDRRTDGHGVELHRDVDAGFGLSPHQERYVDKRSDIRLDPRMVTFQKDKEMGLGLRLAGGNTTGIFIASVQARSAAEEEGIVEGDQILKANNRDITGLTREDAVVYLSNLSGDVSLVVQYRKEEYDHIMASREAGDSFFIKTHFNYTHKDTESGEMSFTNGMVLHVLDTLYRGVVGSWIAKRIDTDQDAQKGIIPNKHRAQELSVKQRQSDGDKESTPSLRSRGSLFRKRSGRRSKSLSRDHWEDVIFVGEDASLDSKFPGYETVIFRHPGFFRPVVIYGALSDVARSRLLTNYPGRFESVEDSGSDDPTKHTGIIRLSAIRQVITKEKHCVLDVTPHAVDRLNYAQYYPIVIYLKPDSKQTVKDLRTKHAKTSSKNHKKLYEQGQKLEKLYSHLFTVTLPHGNSESWYDRLENIIDEEQKKQTWMSEKKPDDDISDDILFPMANRLSFSPESELDLSRRSDDADYMTHPRLKRASSDPSVATTEKIPGIPPYPVPPSYQSAKQRSPSYEARDLHRDDRRRLFSDTNLPDRGRGHPEERGRSHPEDRYYPSYYADGVTADPRRPPQPQWASGKPGPAATLPAKRISEDALTMNDLHYTTGHYSDYREPFRDPHNPPRGATLATPHQPQRSPVDPRDLQRSPVDPRDLQRSPLDTRDTPTYTQHSPSHQPQDVFAHRVNIEPTYGKDPKIQNDSSSHSSDSYTKHMTLPENQHDDSKLEGLGPAPQHRPMLPSHDPYRFTRSTATPVNTANIDKGKLSDLSAKYRKDEPPRPVKGKSPPVRPLEPPQHTPRDKREPPPVPPKTYTLAERGFAEHDEFKLRNYENSNRSYGYSDYSAVAPKQGVQPQHVDRGNYSYLNNAHWGPVANGPVTRNIPNNAAIVEQQNETNERFSNQSDYNRGNFQNDSNNYYDVPPQRHLNNNYKESGMYGVSRLDDGRGQFAHHDGDVASHTPR